MQVQNGNKYLGWKTFGIISGIAIVIMCGTVTMSINAFRQANANELKINGIQITEELHYQEVLRSLSRIEKTLNIKQ